MDNKGLMMSLVLLLSVLAVAIRGHSMHMGRTCPSITPFPNLSMDKLLGVWYVVYKFDTSNTCIVWNFTKVAEDNYKVTEERQISALDTIRINHKHKVTASLDIPNPEVPARMRIRWPTSLTGKADFVIFDTDYTDYMAVFECDRAGFLHRRSVAILSRASVMDQMFVDRIRRKLDTAKIPHDALNIVDHNICRDESRYNWHIDGEYFGLGGDSSSPQNQEQRLGEGVHDYDISQIEILGDGVEEANNFQGSLRKPRSGMQ